ncbi:hypothetical protein H310_10590 [Aphanomyces invadans]|uniref:Cytochrome b5 heme-binding domain-containing protein n=1 Tax=Aphanomyces invadans TaxID=157072 RepID=A0A024TPM3_9STRA|nr:hypothetical protein H310_10590 [Aphanomyces invadans]ETV95929.1 hypothetical protein H310_10590 [Aphanomyces invadans]|eukprot:XP_008875240.1 hypothetical protein H310_10590 [Aphanomyces invadans]
MQMTGQHSAECPRPALRKPSLEKGIQQPTTYSQQWEIEDCSVPLVTPIPRRERRQSVELVYSDVVDHKLTEQPGAIARSPKKGTCVVQTRCTDRQKLCLCEVKRHRSLSSCWLVANGIVYDVTNVIQQHPAGTKCILRKAGGVDCTQDLRFHSKEAQQCWKQCAVGKLLPCGDDDGSTSQDSCTIM